MEPQTHETSKRTEGLGKAGLYKLCVHMAALNPLAGYYQGDEIEALSEKGYVVEMVMPVDVVVELKENKMNVGERYAVAEARQTLARTVAVLLRQDEETAVAILYRERDEARCDRVAIRSERDLALQKLAELERKLAEIVANNSDTERTIAIYQREANELRSRNRKLEGDLAKVRAAIGTKAYNEIVPG